MRRAISPYDSRSARTPQQKQSSQVEKRRAMRATRLKAKSCEVDGETMFDSHVQSEYWKGRK